MLPNLSILTCTKYRGFTIIITALSSAVLLTYFERVAAGLLELQSQVDGSMDGGTQTVNAQFLQTVRWFIVQLYM